MTDVLLSLLLGAAIGAGGALAWVGWKLNYIVTYARETHREVMEVKLHTRTRQNKVSVQSGPKSQEQLLSKLGRASSARRVVVGGDPDSELNQNINTTSPAMVDND